MRRLITCTILFLCTASTLNAQTRNWIYQWNNAYNIGNDPNSPDPEYLEIIQSGRRITINQGIQNATFEFEARKQKWEGGQWVDDGPGDINKMEALENAGPVAITVVGHGGHVFGASNVLLLQLNQAGVNSSVKKFNIKHDLGDDEAARKRGRS